MTRYRPRLTRRRALALAAAGVAGLAGCSSLPLAGGEETVELDGGEIAAVAEGSVPTVTEPLPVEIADAHVAASRTRAESLLDGVPLPLSADELPNGVMRRELAHSVERAREALAEADGATAVRERLDALREARESARVVDASWAYANGELTAEDVREAGRSVRDEATAFRADWTYVGANPVRALLVHDVVESWSGAARRDAEVDGPGHRDGTNAVTLGERAGEVELGRAHLGDARHVGERFRASLADPGSVRETLTEARESLSETLDSRRSDLPGEEVSDPDELVDVDRDLRGTPAGGALRVLHWRIPHEFGWDGEPASAVVGRACGLAYVEAFASLRDRVADGATFAVESVSDVRERRSAAVSAIETALADSGDRRLARRLLADRVRWMASVDRDLRRYDGTVRASLVDRDIDRYVALASFARAVPQAVGTTLDALDTGSD